MKQVKEPTFASYLESLRVQIGKHGKDRIEDRFEEISDSIGFMSPDGWWVVPASAVRTAAAEEIRVSRKFKKSKATDAFISWFQTKMADAIKAGERLSKEGLS